MEAFGQSIWDEYVTKGVSSDESGGLVLGIDFGSSNSCVAVWRADKNKVKIIRNASTAAAKTTPSLIQFNEAFKGYKIGNECDASMDHVISNLKALILHPETETSSGPDSSATPHSPWVDGTTLKCFDRPTDLSNSASNPDKRTAKTVPVEELVGFVLSYLKDCAEDYLTRRPIKKFNIIDGSEVETTTHYADTTSNTTSGTTATPSLRAEVNRVVLGVPVNCTEGCKQSLKSAAQLAGFSEVHFLVESTAAATAYGLTVAGTKNVLVFDMGGGTTDLSIMHIDNGRLSVRGTGGNNVLGGKNVDALLLELVVNKAQALTVEEKEVFRSLSRTGLLQLCRACKEELSTEESSTITIPYTPTTTTNTTTDPTAHTHTVSIVVSREEFEVCALPVTHLVQATVHHTVQTWLQQQSTGSIVGNGSTSDATTAAPVAATRSASDEEEADGFVRVNPVTAVSPTVATAEESNKEAHPHSTSTTPITSIPVNPTTTHTIDEVVLVGGSSRIPCVRQAIRLALGNLGIEAFLNGTKELCTSLNPEEVVAEGLAVRGAVLSGVSGGKLRELLVMDCVNNAIGVMTWEPSEGTSSGTGNTNGTSGTSSGATSSTRVFNSILHKGMSIPAHNSLRLPLEHAQQKVVSLDIYEEVEECRLRPTSSSSGGSSGGVGSCGVGDVGGGSSGVDSVGSGESAYEMVYKYHVVATADVPIPAINSVDSSNDSGSSVDSSVDSGSVDITFTMTSDGILQFNVVRVQTTTSTNTNTTEVNSSANMLIVYIVLMFVLYLFVKITLTEVEVSGVSSAVSSVESVIDDTICAVGDVCEAVGSVLTEL